MDIGAAMANGRANAISTGITAAYDNDFFTLCGDRRATAVQQIFGVGTQKLNGKMYAYLGRGGWVIVPEQLGTWRRVE